MATSVKGKGVSDGNRLTFLDNLRTFVVFLVVLCHAGLVYERSGIGALFWIVDDPSVSALPDLINIALDIVMMPTLFFLSGYLAPASLKRKSGWRFLKAKFIRLILPWAVGIVTLIPLYKVLFLASRSMPQEHWTTYFHFSNGIFGQNWLWFLPVLFLFNSLYGLLSYVKIRWPRPSLRVAFAAAFLVGWVYSVTMDLCGLRGWTKTAWINVQNERALIYFIAFLLGTLCWHRGVFTTRSENKRRYVFVAVTVWLPLALYGVFLVYPQVHPGQWPIAKVVDSLLCWLGYQLSLFGLVYLLIETFRRYQAQQGRFKAVLNTQSYAVYVIHTVVLGAIAWPLTNTILPAEIKYLLLTVTTFGISHGIVFLYRTSLTKCHRITIHTEVSPMKTVTTALCCCILIVPLSGCRKQDSITQEQEPPHVDLHIAALQGNLVAIRQHIHAGSDLNAKDPYGSTPLTVAATFGKTEVARALIEAGADTALTNNEGSTPLHIAAFLCRTEIVQALLDSGADRGARNHAGSTPWESVAGPFMDVKPVYDAIVKGLKPLGFRLDYQRIEETRPVIAKMLRP